MSLLWIHVADLIRLFVMGARRMLPKAPQAQVDDDIAPFRVVE